MSPNNQRPQIDDAFIEEPSRFFNEWLPERMAENRGRDKKFGKVGAVAQLELTGDRGGAWYFRLDKEGVALVEGRHDKPSFTVSMPVPIWQQMSRKELSGMRAWMRGDIKFSGSRLAFLRVARLFSN